MLRKLIPAIAALLLVAEASAAGPPAIPPSPPPVMSTTVLGVAKIDGTTITISNGVISSASGGTGCLVSGAAGVVNNNGASGCVTDTNAVFTAGSLALGASGTAGQTVFGNATSGTLTLKPVAGALGVVTASLPANTGTIAELNLAQSWTAAQAFGSGLTANGGASVYYDKRTAYGAATVSIAATDRYVTTCNNSDSGCSAGTWNTAATWTLPAYTAVTDGYVLTFADDPAVVTNINTLSIAPGSGDTINNSASATVLSASGSKLTCQLDATNRNWDCHGSLTGGVAGAVLIGQGATVAPNYLPIGGDATLTSLGLLVNTKVNGITYPSAALADSVPTATAIQTMAYKVIPDCDDSSGNHINYDTTTHAWSCGTSTSGVSTLSFGTTGLTPNSATAGAITVAGTLAVANGGTGLTTGTSGGVLAYTASGTLASSGALTANLPVIGGGAGVAPTVGSRSGNTTKYVTTTGTLTSGDCVKIDASGNFIANGSACGSSGSGGGTFNYSDNGVTVTAGTYYIPIGGGGIPQSTEANVSVAAPSATTVANLSVSVSVAPGTGNSYTITLRDAGADKAVTCAIADTATTCVDNTHSFNVAAGDLIDWKFVSAGTIVTTPTVNISAANGTSGVGVTSVATTSPLAGGTITTTGTITCATCVTSAAALTSGSVVTGAGSQASQTNADFTFTTGTLSLGVNTSEAGGLKLFGATSGNTTLKAAAVAGTNTVITFPGGTTDFSATGGTSQYLKQASAGGALTVGTIAAGDLPGGSNATTVSGQTCTLGSTCTVPIPFLGVDTSLLAQNSTNYIMVTGATSYNSAENVRQQVMPKAMTFGNFYCQLASSATLAVGQTLTLTLRVNGATPANGPVCTMTGTGAATATGNDTGHTAAVIAGDLVSILVVASATTGNIALFNWGILAQ